MYTFLLVLLILDSIVLGVAILLQSAKGGGLAASFGGASSSPDAFIGTRQAGNLLTAVTWWGTGIFLVLAFVLQIMSSRSRMPTSVLEGQLANPAAPVAPAPSEATPALPLEAAPTTPDSPQSQPPQ